MDENNMNNIPPVEEPIKKEKKKKKHTGWKIFLILLLCCLIGIPAYIGGKAIYDTYSSAYSENGMKGVFNRMVNGQEDVPDEAPVDSAVPSPLTIATPAPAEKVPVSSSASGDMDESQIFESTVDSMVSITTTVEGYNFFGQRVKGEASGSGFILTKDGYVLTNYHVVDGSSAISVNLYNGDTYNASLVGYDSSNDVAVLKVDAADLKPVTLGDSDALKEGQHVVAIGNALGRFSFSITNGIISGIGRDVQVSSNHTMSLLQVSCAINSGNSGGALLNMKGEVVGITNAKYGSSGYSSEASVDNVGFAIPINSVEKIVEDIINKGVIEKAYIGISGNTASADVCSTLDIKGGAKVYDVIVGSPAEEAGLQADDIIYAVDGKDVLTFDDLSEYIATLKGGDEVTLSIYRKTKAMDVKLTVGTKEESATPNEDAAAAAPEEGQSSNMPEGYGNYGNYGNYGSQDWMQQFFNYYGF